jgi:hypothetical protein
MLSCALAKKGTTYADLARRPTSQALCGYAVLEAWQRGLALTRRDEGHHQHIGWSEEVINKLVDQTDASHWHERGAC